MSGLLMRDVSLPRVERVPLPSGALGFALAAGTAAMTAGLAGANGGYFASSWGWSALILLWVALIALLLVRPVLLSRLELTLLGAVAGLAAWTFLSVTWASSQTQAVFEGERTLVLFGAVAAVVVLSRYLSTRALLGGVLAGVVVICGYALLTRLLPERLGRYDQLAVYRLNTPIGYWNGLGLFATMGVLLAFGYVARARLLAVRMIAASSLLVLLPTLYFTYSRGAWVALAIGIVAALALDPSRLEMTVSMAAFGALPAVAVALAARSPALTHQHALRSRATHEGHHLLLWLVLFALVQALVALGYREAQRRLVIARAAKVSYGMLLVLAAVAALAAVFIHYGTPWDLTRRAYHGFTTPASTQGTNLNARLFSFSGSGRWQLWQVAGSEVRAHPLLGGGAGSYAAYWAQERPVTLDVQDAHNLYLEILAELGPLGLALLLAVFAVPVAAATRARRYPLVPAAFGAFVAYIAHAVVDWDWELSGLTLAAMFAGLACVRATRRDDAATFALGPRRRFGGAVVLAALSAFTLIGLLANAASGASDATARGGDWQASARHARQAIRWAPWSSRGWQQLGEAQLAQGELAQARQSLQRAIAKDRGNWVLWLDLASSERGVARRAALAEARRLNPLAPELHL